MADRRVSALAQRTWLSIHNAQAVFSHNSVTFHGPLGSYLPHRGYLFVHLLLAWHGLANARMPELGQLA
ncbi:hypothetical protein ACLKA7_003103 [Drosophila subpalustris]